MNTDTIPASSVSSALTVQGRVIYALVLREVHTLYGNTRLGYLWAIIQTAFNIAVFWLFREFLGAHSRHGMGIGVFLLCGFIPWHMVSDTLSRCMSAVRANQALLTFPQVTELDLMIARVVVVWGTQIICAVVILIMVVSIGQVAELRNPGTLAATLLFAPLLGIGMGLVFAPLAHTGKTHSYRDAFFVLCVRRFFSGFRTACKIFGYFAVESCLPNYRMATLWLFGFVRSAHAQYSLYSRMVPRLTLSWSIAGALRAREGTQVIELSRICKSYSLPRGNRKDVLRDASIIFRPGVNMGILGLNGQGKSTLIRIISGSELPDSGTIKRKGRVSWPIGFTGGFNGSLTGRENLRFTCRIYGADIREVTNFVETFTELGPYMDMPVKTYSSGMRSKLAFGLSMAIGFDFYLIDEAWSVGDASFQAKAEKVFKERKARSTLIVVSHSVATIRKNCDSAAVLHDGILTLYDKLDDALRIYMGICHARQ